MFLAVLLNTVVATSDPASVPAPIPVSTTYSEAAWVSAASQEPNVTERRTYLRIAAGLNTTEDSDGPGGGSDVEFDDGYLVGLAIGRRMGASESGIGFGLELEALWTDQDAEDDGPIDAVRDVTVAGAFLNGLVDFRIADSFTIFGSAGLGPAWLDIGTTSDAINDFDDEDGPFLAWQLRAGVAWHLGESTAFHLAYRFLNVDDAEIDDDLGAADFDLETQQHGIEAGFTFGI